MGKSPQVPDLEHGTHNSGVGGSSLPVATIQIQRLMIPSPVPVFSYKCRVSVMDWSGMGDRGACLKIYDPILAATVILPGTPGRNCRIVAS